MRFPIVIHKDPNSDYGVTVPDLPGCFSAGDTLDAAIENAHEAIECHIEGLLIDHEPVPTPRQIDDHQNNPDYADGVWALISVDLSRLEGKAKRVNVTIPERLLKQIDRFAKREGESRSGLLTRAALEYVTKRNSAH